MIEGVHVLLYSPRAAAVRAFLRDVLALELTDATPEWPIFALPPSEVGVHPTDGEPRAEFYLLTRDIEATLDRLRAAGQEVVGDVAERNWGRVAVIRLPDGSELPIYQPKHRSVLDETAR